MAIQQDPTTILDGAQDPIVQQSEIALALANGSIYQYQTTSNIYVTAVRQQFSSTSVTNVTNEVAGANGEIQFYQDGKFSSDKDFKYDATTDTLILSSLFTSNLDLLSPSNISIGGGNAGMVLSTDGSGNLAWINQQISSTLDAANVTFTPANNVVSTNVQGAIAELGAKKLALTGGTMTGPLLLSSNPTTALGAATKLYVDMAISAIAATPELANTANYAGNITVAAQPNITSVGTLTSLAVSGLITGDGGGLSNINGANVVGAVASATVAASANSVAGANVTGAVAFATTANSVAAANVSGTVASATVAASANSVAGANVVGAVALATSATTANSVAGANVSGQVANALVAGTVYSASQPNITSVGTLTGLTSGGIVNLTSASNVSLGPVSNVKITGGTTGQVLSTDGTGVLSWTTPAVSATGVTVIDDTTSATSYVTFTSATSGFTPTVSVTSSKLKFHPSSGQLTSEDLIATGNIYAAKNVILSDGATGTGNIGFNPTLAGGAGAYEVFPDNFGVTIGRTASDLTVMGDVDGTFAVGNGRSMTRLYGDLEVGDTTISRGPGNVTVTGDLTVAGITNLGLASNVVIDGGTSGQVLSTDGVGGLSWTTVAAGATATAETLAGTTLKSTIVNSSLTSVGTLTSLAVTGAVTGASFTGSHSGAGNNLSNIQGANVSGAVAFATTANSVAGANVSGQVANALVAGTVYTADQPNITSVGTLTGLASGGTVNMTTASNVSLGPVANVHITGGTSGQVLTTDGSGGLTWATASSGSSLSPLTEISTTPTMSTRNYSLAVGTVIGGVLLPDSPKWVNSLNITDPTVQTLSFTDLGGSLGSLSLSSCNALTTLSFPSLTTTSSPDGVSLNNMATISTVDLPVISKGGFSASNCPSLSSLSMPALANCSGIMITNSTGVPITTVSLPLVTTTITNFSYFLNFQNCPSLTTISIPLLESVFLSSGWPGTSIYINNCISLTTFAFPTTLVSMAGGVTISGCALSQASVDNILVRLAALDGTGGTTTYSSKTINLSGGTSATPSATGLAAKVTLVARGCTVTHN